MTLIDITYDGTDYWYMTDIMVYNRNESFLMTIIIITGILIIGKIILEKTLIINLIKEIYGKKSPSL